jgi:hypothetical protein
MTKTGHLFVGLMVALASYLSANSAYALNDHSWISSTGGGMAACTRADPCLDFPTAQAATKPGGIVSLLDAGSVNAVNGFNVTKSLIIRAEGIDAGSSTSPASGLWMSITVGPTDVVTVEGLKLDGLLGIAFNSGGHLHVVKCVINSGGSGIANNAGIRFQPNSASKLSVTDTVISNMGSGTGGGILIIPQAGGSARVNLERVTVNGNAFGIAVDGSGSTAGINVTIADSMIGGNSQDGIVATTPSGGAPIGVLVTNTKSVNNNNFGIRSIGANVTVRVNNSDIAGNGTGLSSSGGGALLSFGNNAVRANGSDGVFSGSVGLQ